MKFKGLRLLILSMCLLCTACTGGGIQSKTDAVDGTSDTREAVSESTGSTTEALQESETADTKSQASGETAATESKPDGDKTVVDVVFFNRTNGYADLYQYRKSDISGISRAYEKTDDPEQLFAFTAYLFPVPGESTKAVAAHVIWPEICDTWGVIQYDNYGYEPEDLYFLATFDQVEAIEGKTILGYAVQVRPLNPPFLYEKAAPLLEKLEREGIWSADYSNVAHKLFTGPKQVEVEIEIPTQNLERARGVLPGTYVVDATSDVGTSMAETTGIATEEFPESSAAGSAPTSETRATTGQETDDRKETVGVIFSNKPKEVNYGLVTPSAYEKTDDPEQLFAFTAYPYPSPVREDIREKYREGYERWPEICDAWGVIRYDNFGYEPEFCCFLATLDQVEAMKGKAVLGYALEITPLFPPYIYEEADRLREGSKTGEVDPHKHPYDFISAALFSGPDQIEVEIEIPVRDLEQAGRK